MAHLHGLAAARRRARFASGALRLNKTKLWFALDPETGRPIGTGPYVQRASNFLVEELMLLANETVARYISAVFPHRALLRRHPPPLQRKMEQFRCDPSRPCLPCPRAPLACM